MSQENVIKTAPAQPLENTSPPDLWTILKIWLLIGAQSFGGGPSTIFQIRREFIQKRNWLTEEDYARFWVLCQITPGINIIALTILVGHQLRGWAGIFVSLFGMLFPSATITTLLAVGFTSVQHWPPMQSILRGITPATAGISLLVALQFAVPMLKKAKAEGLSSLSLSLLIIAVSTFLVGILKLPVALVLVCAAAVGAFTFVRFKKEGLA